MASEKKIYTVTKQENNRGFWDVKKDGNSRNTRVGLTQKDARKLAREHAGLDGNVYLVDGNNRKQLF